MADAPLGYWDYVKAAFNWRSNVPGLGLMPWNKLLLAGFGVLGFGHPAFWLLGLGWEAAWLLFLPGNERFQRLVRGQRMLVEQSEWRDREVALLSELDSGLRLRYTQLAARCDRLVESARQHGGDLGAAAVKSADLSHLLWIFLKLLHSQMKIRDVLARTSRAGVEEEIALIKQKLAREGESSAIAHSLQQTLQIQEQRLANLKQADEGIKVSEAELYRIEKQICLLQEELAVSRDPAQLSEKLDGVMEGLRGTTQWMSEHAEFFGSLDEPAAPPPLGVREGKQAEKH